MGLALPGLSLRRHRCGPVWCRVRRNHEHDGFGADRYGADVLAAGWRDAGRRAVPRVAATPELVVEIAGDGFCGAVTGIQSGHVELEDRLGRRRLFPLGGGFLIDGQAVVLRGAEGRGIRPAPHRLRIVRRRDCSRPRGPRLADPRGGTPRRRARREGVGRMICGSKGVVVEFLQGVDLLDDAAAPPSRPGRLPALRGARRPSRAGVEGVARRRCGRARTAWKAHVRIVGHPFVDVWQCVTPRALGIAKPGRTIPRGIGLEDRDLSVALSAGHTRTIRATPVGPGSTSCRSRAQRIAISSPRSSAGSKS